MRTREGDAASGSSSSQVGHRDRRGGDAIALGGGELEAVEQRGDLRTTVAVGAEGKRQDERRQQQQVGVSALGVARPRTSIVRTGSDTAQQLQGPARERLPRSADAGAAR